MKLRIEKAIYGGAGFARVPEEEGALAGKAAFVQLGLPGELVTASIVEDNRGFVKAELDSVIEPSLARTSPACPYFGACGGCSYQHAVYRQQIEMKTSILRETLDRAHIAEVPPIHAMHGAHWGYRNRVRLAVQREPFALCYRERRSHSKLAVDRCPIAGPLLEKAITTVTNIGASASGAGFFDEVEFFTASDETSLLISLWTDRAGADSAGLSRFCEALRAEPLPLAGAVLFHLDDRRDSGTPLSTWGEDCLTYRAADFDFRVSAGSFFQVNRFLVEGLAELVTSNRSGKLAWDLYAGVGLFSRALSPAYERVIAVEAAPASYADLRYNLRGTVHKAIRSTTLDFLRRQTAASPKPDLVVVDPPRAGLGREIASQLARIAPVQIVYVSCDPATLSRDLAALIQSGYDLQTITMVDMFPQTFHLESVSVLTRR